MKQIFFLIAFFLLFVMNGFGQERDTVILKTSNDTNMIIVTKKTKTTETKTNDTDTDETDEMEAPEAPEVPEAPNQKRHLKDVKMRWVMVDYGISTYVGKDGLNLPSEYPYSAFEQNLWKSSNWNLHLFKMKVNMIKHNVNLMTGLSFEFYRYNWVNNYILKAGDAPIVPFINTNGNGETIKYDKNRMYTSWLTMPLMLNFESNPYKNNSSFHLNAGVFAGVKLASNIRLENDQAKAKITDNFNLNNFRYGLTGSIGYGPVNLYANYSLVPLFKSATQTSLTQPELFPLNFGIQLIGF